MSRIGFVGLGAMGRPMAKRLLGAGHALLVHDVQAGPVQELERLGATAMDNPADLAAGSEVVITMLPDGPDVLAVVNGPSGILAGLRPGAALIEMSTIDPSITQQIAASVAGSGCRFLDAPCGRTSRHAEEGALFIMVGGDEAVFTELRPILEPMGTDITYCGPAGSGATMKLINNLLTTITVAANAEVLALGVTAGLELEKILEVLGQTAAANTHLRSTYPAQVLAGNFEPGFANRLAFKDLALAVRLAGDLRMPTPLGAAALQVFAMARSLGHDADDYTTVLTVLEQYAGREIRLEGVSA